MAENLADAVVEDDEVIRPIARPFSDKPAIVVLHGSLAPESALVALDSAGLESEVAFVSDRQLSGLCNEGLTVAEVAPEAAVGGPLVLVENGDQITIDVDARALDLDVPEEELTTRRARRREPELPSSRGYLSIYQRSVQPMSTGAVLVQKD